MTIYPRGKKKIFVADFWQDGIHRKVTLSTSNKKVAIERATRIASDLHQGTYRSAPVPIDLIAAMAEFVRSQEVDGKAPKTLVKSTGVFKTFQAFLGSRRVTKLHQVTASLIDAFRAEHRKTRSPKTVFNDCIILKQLFKWAKSRKLLLENPLAEYRLTRPRFEPKETPSLPQVTRILAAADEPLRTWLHVLAFTGMRVGELQRLRREDVDLIGNWIHIVSRPGAETKTRESRKVPIHPRLRAILERRPKSTGVWYFTAGMSRKYPKGGHSINPQRVNDRFIKLLGHLKLPSGKKDGFTAHSFRRFFETFCVNSRIPQRVVDGWLGHKSDRSMAAVYYRLLDVDSQRFMTEVPFDGPAPIADPNSE